MNAVRKALTTPLTLI